MTTKFQPPQRNSTPTGCNKSLAKTIKAHEGLVMLRMGPSNSSSRTSFTSTSTTKDTPSRSLANRTQFIIKSGLIGGAASAAVLLFIAVWYDFIGAKVALDRAKAERLTLNKGTSSRLDKIGTYNLCEALEMLKHTMLAYASAIPGGSARVEKVFTRLEIMRKTGGAEVRESLAATCEELRVAGKRKATALDMKEIIVKNLLLLSGLPNKVLRDVCGPYIQSL